MEHLRRQARVNDRYKKRNGKLKHSDYLKKKKTRETRKKIISIISAIVVFITTYALVLPAITLDVSKASQEPGIAYEQMQFRATAAAASVTAADSTEEEAQVEEPAAEEPEEEPAEEIKEEEPAETPEEEVSAVSDEEEEEEEPEEEAPAEPEKEEAPEVQEDKSEADSAEEKSSESAPAEAEAADTEKAAEDTAVDQTGTDSADAAAAATTAETAAEFKVPELDALDFDEILTGKTNFYYYHVENAEEAEELSSDSIDDWKKVGSDTVLAPEDFVRVYLSYEIPAGALNETNAVARYKLPAGLELSDKQIKAINKYENGIAASKSGSEKDKYLGAEAIEGSRTPDQDADDEYIAATVKVEEKHNGRQELVFTFIPYTVEKNQISYDEKGEVKSKGKEVKGFFTFDLKTSQIDFEKTSIETVDKEDGTTEEIQYSQAKVDFTKDIDRTLKLAGPVTKEEAQTAEPKTLTSEGADYTVTVSYTDEAQIPDNAELTVREIEKDTEEYASYLEQAKGAVENTKSVNEARFFDITIVADGEKVEPQAPVSVQINFAGIEQTSTDDTQLLHYKESDEVEVMDQAEFSKSEEQTVDTVQFETDGFSVYGIVSTELVTEFTISNPDGKDVTYLVTVTYGPEANIPEGSTLRVVPFAEGSEDYVNARNAVLADKKAKDEPVDIDDFNLAALDISIIDPNGQEIEPEAAVTVDIKIKDLPGVENLDEVKDTLEIQHHVEVPDGVVVEKVFDGSVEGSYKMDTDENIAKEGTAVDPSSVSDDDFRNIETTEDDSVDASFDTEVFSTFTITWRTGYNARTVTVHYVDESGNELPIANPDSTHPNMTANSSSPAFLIYDIDGYEYSYTYRNTNTNANRIAPLLSKNNNNYWRYTGTGNVNWQEMSNGDNIYVVYKKKTDPTTGGTAVIDDAQESDWPQGSATPQFGKSSTNNGNKTNTVSLSISGGEAPYERSTKANVIVVFDRSGSMGGNNIWRLNTAKSAVNTMAETLLDGDITGVKMALVAFSTTASTVQEFTDDYDTYRSTVDGLTASGGTNWEQALAVANRMAVDSDAATFVVFVTDGDPTFRVSRGDVNNPLSNDIYTGETYQYYRNNQVFGTGSSDNAGRNFDYAAKEVESILASNKTFYAIGVSTDVTKVQNLVNEAGGGTAYLATDEDALKEAFANITQSIRTNLGFGDVEITDGITSMSSAEIKAVNVDPESFKYYRIVDGVKTEWTTRETDGCAAATYTESDGAVHWDMGENFQLENGVTYVVEFIVWPSQEAYDLVADLNNGIRQFDELTEAEKAQVVEVTAPTETSTGTYALRTNTDKVEATYNRTSKTGETVTISDTKDVTATYHEGTIQNMSLDSDFITVKKEWHNALDSRVVDGITLTVTKDDAAYLDDVALDNSNNWTSDEQYISSGFITTTSDGRYNVRETGHEYTVTEPAEFSYYWDLSADTYRPMVIDGTLRMLIKTDNPTGTEGVDYYVIGGNKYQVSNTTTPQLTASNDRRSNLNLKKIVTAETQAVDKVPNPDDVFTYTITVTDANGDDVWFSAMDESGTTVPIESYSSNVTAAVDEDGNPTGSYSVPSGAQFTISIKAGWNVRFFNLPRGTTYSIQETGMEDGYEFIIAETSAEVTKPEYAEDFKATPGTVNGNTVTGTIDQPNNVYSTDYTNNWNPNNEIVIIKTDEKDAKLAGATFKLSKLAGEEWEEITTFTSKETAGETLKVGRGQYKLEETTAPTDYYTRVDTVYFRVVTSGNSTTVVLTDEDGEEIEDESLPTEYPDVTASGNEVTVKNWPFTTDTALKAWKNADGSTTAPAGASVVFTLYADDEETAYTVTLDGTADSEPTGTGIAGYESEGWKAEFVNLPKYNLEGDEPKEIEYTIAETTTYPGYTPSTTDPVADGKTITNTQEATTANAFKAWKNADGTTTAPDGATVTYTLYADGAATTYTVTLDGNVDTAPTGTAGYESEAWKAEFVNLPKYKIVEGAAVEIVYTIAETTTYPGYTASTTDPVASGETITNSQGSTETFAVKAWKNADGSTDAPDGATVVFTLYSDDEATDYMVTLDGEADQKPTGTAGYESEAWKATFVNLPQSKIVDGEAVDIVYTIAETTGYPGYTASTTEPVASGSTITNSQDPTTANALKAWVNADGTTEAPQGGQVTYTLYADGTATEYTVTLDGTVETAPEGTGGYESEAWKAEFVNLPKYQPGTTTEIVYTIAETTTYPGYAASTTAPVASGETITNTQEPTNADALKAWKNADGTTTPPEGATVVFKLYADGEATEYTVTLDGTPDTAPASGTAGYESEAWKAVFVNLPKYKIVEGAAVEIEYTIAETTTYAGYTPSTTDPIASGGTIINEQVPTEANAFKAWVNADGTTKAPEGATVEFTLYVDGEKSNYAVTLDGEVDSVPEGTAGYESEPWKASFIGLAMYKADGITEIEYTIAETQGYPGYKASTTDPVASGETITNSQLSAEIKLLKIGDGQSDTKLDDAKFELYSVWNGPDATDNVKAKDAVSGTEIGTITTANGGTAAIGKLLPGTYYLVETKAPDGYKILTDPVEIKIELIDADPGYKVSYIQKDYNDSTGAGGLSPEEDGTYLITVSDPSGKQLPMTGGSGTFLYTLSGIALIFASALMYGFRMRRRERRLN